MPFRVTPNPLAKYDPAHIAALEAYLNSKPIRENIVNKLAAAFAIGGAELADAALADGDFDVEAWIEKNCADLPIIVE